MNALSAVVKEVSKNQGDAVSGILERLLRDLVTRLDKTFGQQFVQLNAAYQKTSELMNANQESMVKLVERTA